MHFWISSISSVAIYHSRCKVTPPQHRLIAKGLQKINLEVLNRWPVWSGLQVAIGLCWSWRKNLFPTQKDWSILDYRASSQLLQCNLLFRTGPCHWWALKINFCSGCTSVVKVDTMGSWYYYTDIGCKGQALNVAFWHKKYSVKTISIGSGGLKFSSTKKRKDVDIWLYICRTQLWVSTLNVQ